MSRERALRRELRTLDTLGEVIAALRALSAQHFRAARAQLVPARAYRDELLRFLAVLEAPSDPPPAAAPAGVVLVAADLGLVGDYAARLVREALALRQQHGSGPLVCLGRRAALLLARAGVEPAAVQPAPGSVGAIPALLLPLVDELLALRARTAFASLWLVAARFEGAGAYTPVRVPVLPVPVPTDGPRLPPTPYGSATQLRRVVVREYLYAVLYETLLESLSSEHGKRLVTAEAARSWLCERTASARRLLASLRREASTQEVLELTAAARAPEAAR